MIGLGGTGLRAVALLLGGLFWLLLAIGLIALVVAGVRALWHAGSPKPAGAASGTSSRALEIVQERYARGEITKEQYDALRRDLTT